MVEARRSYAWRSTQVRALSKVLWVLVSRSQLHAFDVPFALCLWALKDPNNLTIHFSAEWWGVHEVSLKCQICRKKEVQLLPRWRKTSTHCGGRRGAGRARTAIHHALRP